MGRLDGRTVAFLEARRSEEMARLVERQGGTPYIAPALREVPADDLAAVRSWIGDLVAGQFGTVVFLTGVGCRAVIDTAERTGILPALLAALDRVRVVARGPKPVFVLKQHNVRIDFVPPEPNTSDDLLAAMSTWVLGGTVVGLQVYGGTTAFLERLIAGLEAAGAVVAAVAPYRWERPVDERPLRDLIAACQAGQIHALAILSSSQIHNLFAVAEELDQGAALVAALNSPAVLVAAVGPVAAEAIRSHGIGVDLQPEHPKMGPLVIAIGDALQRRSLDSPAEVV